MNIGVHRSKRGKQRVDSRLGGMSGWMEVEKKSDEGGGGARGTVETMDQEGGGMMVIEKREGVGKGGKE